MNKSLRPILLTGLIFLGLLFYLYYGIYKMVFVHFYLVGVDFIKGYFAAQNYFGGYSIYLMPKDTNPYFYPPLATILFFPFSKLTPHLATILWFILTHFIIVISACVLYRLGSGKSRINSAVAIIVSFGFSMPLYSLILTGNINIIIFAGITTVYFSVLTMKRNLSPLILSGCVYMKLYPAFFMIPFARQRNYKACIYFLISIIILGILSIGVFGFDEHYAFLKQLSLGAKYVGIFHSMSFTYFLKLILPGSYGKTIIVCNIIFGSSLLILWWKITKRALSEGYEKTKIIVDLFIMTVVAMLVFPSSWMMYHAFFIFPFYFIIFTILENNYRLKYVWVFFTLFFLISFGEIINYHLPLSFDCLTIRDIGLNRDNFPVLYLLSHSLPFVLNLVFFFWLLLNYDGLQKSLKSFSN